MANLALHAVLLSSCLAASSCSTTMESKPVRHSGFLSDYARLGVPESGGGMSWANPDFDLADYDSLFVPNVEMWLSQDNDKKLTKENAGRISGMFRSRTLELIAKRGWRIADKPGKRTATLRLALTELNAADPVGNLVAGSAPYLGTAVKVLAITADVHFFVGEVSTEVQILDSTTGKILAEALDRRVGNHSVWNTGSTWGDVEDAIGVWTERLAHELSKLRKR